MLRPSMESQPQKLEFRNKNENFHPCIFILNVQTGQPDQTL